MAWRHRYPRRDDGCEGAGAALTRQATGLMAGLVEARGITRKDLAERMGVSPGRISQILSGDENLTLRSLTAVATALDTDARITFTDTRPPEPSRLPGDTHAGPTLTDASTEAPQVAIVLAGLVEARGITRKDLAERMGVSPGRISQILSGDENLTLRSLTAVATALDTDIRITFTDTRPAGDAHTAREDTHRGTALSYAGIAPKRSARGFRAA